MTVGGIVHQIHDDWRRVVVVAPSREAAARFLAGRRARVVTLPEQLLGLVADEWIILDDYEWFLLVERPVPGGRRRWNDLVSRARRLAAVNGAQVTFR